MYEISILLGLIAVVTPIIALISFIKVLNLKQQTVRLQIQLRQQQKDLKQLQGQLQDIQSHTQAQPYTLPEEAPNPTVSLAAEPDRLVETAQPQMEHEENEQSQSDIAAQNLTPVTHLPQAKAIQRKPKPAEPSLTDRITQKIKQWFTTGNIPVKIGVLILFAGVAALFKYVTDQGWVHFSMQARLASVSALSIAALAFAWHKRLIHRTFSLSVQGGAIGLLLLCVFAASTKSYSFISMENAFGLTVALIVLTAVLAVAQEAMILAIFSILAGFMAPIWLSTGSNNHVALFSYYAILNAGIFAMSWWRSWRQLNLLGFAFTFGIGTFWGVLSYQPEKFISTEPFLILFFLFYLLIPILNAFKFTDAKRGMVDPLLVFGTPLVALSLQATLLQGSHYTLAGNAFGLGLIYAALAGIVKNKNLLKLRPAYIALAGGFITLAVPLAFSAQQTSCIYALEGLALLWWGRHQSSPLSQLTGFGLQLLAGFSFYGHLVGIGGGYDFASMPIVNAMLVNMLILAGTGFASAWVFFRQTPSEPIKNKQLEHLMAMGAPAAYLWGLTWWSIAGIVEINNDVLSFYKLPAALVFIASTGWLAAQVFRHFGGKLLGLTSTVAIMLGALVAWSQSIYSEHLFAQGGWLAWGIFAVLGWHAISSICRQQKYQEDTALVHMLKIAQFIWWPLWAFILSNELRWVCQTFIAISRNSGWYQMALILPWLLLAAATLWRWDWVRRPLGEMFDTCRESLQKVLFTVGMLCWLLAMLLPSNSAPLPWVTIFNPIDLLQLAFAGMFIYWVIIQKDHLPKTLPWLNTLSNRVLALSIAGFLLTSVESPRVYRRMFCLSQAAILAA